MLEEQLRKHWYFKYTGGYSVNKKSRSVIETLKYSAELLEVNENLVLIFPQGEIQSLHTQVFKFEKGLDRILKNKENKVQVIFLANIVDYFSDSKPSLFQYIKEFDREYDISFIQEKYNAFYRECINDHNRNRIVQ